MKGIDIASKAVSLCKEKLPDSDFEVLDIGIDKTTLNADLIICSDVLEHIEDDQTAINNLAAASNKYVLISTVQGRMREIEKKSGT